MPLCTFCPNPTIFAKIKFLGFFYGRITTTPVIH